MAFSRIWMYASHSIYMYTVSHEIFPHERGEIWWRGGMCVLGRYLYKPDSVENEGKV